MCLENISKEKTAKKKIVVWKRLMIRTVHTLDNIDSYHGKPFTASIDGNPIVGIISIHNRRPYLCNASKPGAECPDKFGYAYSWVLSAEVDNLVIDGEKVYSIQKDIFVTPYQYAVVQLGKVHTSELIVEREQINVGIHSFVNKDDAIHDEYRGLFVVKCFIPKGAKYYTGDFNCKKSIASDQLQYTKEIEEIK